MGGGRAGSTGREGARGQDRTALERRASALETLNAVAESVHRSLDFDTVARHAIRAIRSYEPRGAASILAMSPDGNELLLVAEDGFSPDAIRDRLPVEGSLVGLAIREGRVVTSDDLASDPRGLAGLRDILDKSGLRRAIIVPLVRGERALGVLTLVLPADAVPSAEDHQMLLSVGKTIALAMDNARHVQELRDKDLRYGLATAAGKVGVWDWNVASGAFYLDPNLKALLGFSDAEMPHDLGRWSARIHPDDRERVEAAIGEHLAGRTAEFVCEHRMLHRDGTERVILARGHAVRDDAGRAVRMVGTDADVTERRELEQQMRHAEKLKSLGVLAGGIAHEFNNLLTAILGNAGLAHRLTEPDSLARRRIEQIEAAAQRAAELTRQLLAYSGRGTFALEPVDLAQLVREMAELLHASVSRRARLTLDCPPGLPAVHGDPGQLRQLVINLVTNASEALGNAAGTIGVRTAVAARGAGAPARVALEVTDSGCGIADEDRPRIFEPFFTTKLTGRGLGLAAAQGIVRGHQGELVVESEVGRGSTFRALFTAAEAPRSRADLERPTPAPGSGRPVVLVVDDEPSVRSLVESVLAEAAFEVVQAANGVDALAIFAHDSRRIDLVLLDLSMPSLNGLEILRALREIRPDVRVILSSGYGATDALTEVDPQTLAGFLEKPYHPTRLLAEVERALRS